MFQRSNFLFVIPILVIVYVTCRLKKRRTHSTEQRRKYFERMMEYVDGWFAETSTSPLKRMTYPTSTWFGIFTLSLASRIATCNVQFRTKSKSANSKPHNEYIYALDKNFNFSYIFLACELFEFEINV